MNESGRSEVDLFLHEAMVGASGGLDPDKTRQALEDMQEALVRQMAFMKGAKYKRRKVEARCPACKVRSTFTMPQADPEAVARASAGMLKAGDTLARLSEFLAGKPDSRPADVGRDWLRGLTDEQVRVVQGWVEANGARRGGA